MKTASDAGGFYPEGYAPNSFFRSKRQFWHFNLSPVLMVNILFHGMFIDSDRRNKISSAPKSPLGYFLVFFLIHDEDLPFKMLATYETEYFGGIKT